MFGRADKKTDAAVPTAPQQTPAELRGQEDAAAKNVAECERNLGRAARALELVESRHLAAIADPGVSGAPLAALSRERDELQERVASLERDLALACTARKVAAGLSEAADLAGRWAAQSDEEAAALRGIEEALRAVPAPWAAWERAWAKRRALDAELVKFRRRNPNVTVAAPSDGGSLLTSDLLALAKNVGPALGVLDGLRRERQNPPAKPESVGPLIFIVGDSPRAVAQREALGRSQPAPARTHGRQ